MALLVQQCLAESWAPAWVTACMADTRKDLGAIVVWAMEIQTGSGEVNFSSL